MLPAAGVGNVEYILDLRPVSGGVQQRNTAAAALDIAAHGVVPEIILRAGCGVRPLGVDQQLLMVGIFVEPGRGFEEPRPRRNIPGKLLCGLFSHFAVELNFIRHLYPPTRNQGQDQWHRTLRRS